MKTFLYNKLKDTDMYHELFYALVAVLAVSLISLVGVFSLYIRPKVISKVLLLFVSFAAGALIGDAFLHLIPQIAGDGFTTETALYILSGILLFFIIENIIHWHHCHTHGCGHGTPRFVWTNLIGDSVHNFIDGIIIMASFMINVQVGIATTIAVILHEIPQEIGDFAILMHGGLSKKKALLFNFFSASFAIIGALLLYFVKWISGLTNFLIPFTAGSFIYIAAADLIPELHKGDVTVKSFLHIVLFVIGVGVMALLLFLE